MGRRLHATQVVSLKLVVSADEDLLTTMHGIGSTKPQHSTTQRPPELFEVSFPLWNHASWLLGSQLKYQLIISSWIFDGFVLLFVTELPWFGSCSLICTAVLGISQLLCWAALLRWATGSITRRICFFLSSQQENSCFPTVTQNYVKVLPSIFSMSTQDSSEGPCLKSRWWFQAKLWWAVPVKLALLKNTK